MKKARHQPRPQPPARDTIKVPRLKERLPPVPPARAHEDKQAKAARKELRRPPALPEADEE